MFDRVYERAIRARVEWEIEARRRFSRWFLGVCLVIVTVIGFSVTRHIAAEASASEVLSPAARAALNARWRVHLVGFTRTGFQTEHPPVILILERYTIDGELSGRTRMVTIYADDPQYQIYRHAAPGSYGEFKPFRGAKEDRQISPDEFAELTFVVTP